MVDLPAAPVGSYYIILFAGEGNKPGLIVLEQGDIADDQRGVDGIIQQTQALEGHAHHPAFINQAIHLLGALVLVVIHGQRVGGAKSGGAAGSSLPVDAARVVAGYVRSNLVELQALAHTPDTLHAHFREAVAGGQRA